MDTIERAFFHELGHFVAHEINRLKYDRFGVESISLKRCLRDRNVWCGFCQPRKPVLNESVIIQKPPEISNLHFLLPPVMYGCIFEAHYLNSDFRGCFDCHGSYDIEKWAGWISVNNVNHLKHDLFDVVGTFYKKLKDQSLLDSFLAIEPRRYLVACSGEIESFNVSIQPLLDDLNSCIESHIVHYEELVLRLQIVINSDVDLF